MTFDYPDGPTICDDDPTCTRLVDNVFDTGPATVFVFWGCCTAVILAWCVRRRHWIMQRQNCVTAEDNESKQEHTTALKTETTDSSYGTIDTESEAEPLQRSGSRQMLIEGYAESVLGEIALAAAVGVSLMFLGIWLTLMCDFYWGCQFTSVDNMCLRGSRPILGSSETNNNYFFVVWWLQVFWFSILFWNKPKLRNW